MTEAICDHCKKTVRPDRNGWWIGDDGESTCLKAPSPVQGHEVQGESKQGLFQRWGLVP